MLVVGGSIPPDGDGRSTALATEVGSGRFGDDLERPTVVVTTNILGDMVTEVVGGLADVEVIMPLGSEPHEFAASAREAEAMAEADLLVVSGAGFEEGLLDIIDDVRDAGVPIFAFAEHVDLLADDPHIWTDPSRMATAIGAFADDAAGLEGVDAAALETQATAYIRELTRLDAEIADALADVPPDRRVLVTNHEVFGYFADRYDFEVIGAVIPSLTTSASASAADVDTLAALIEANDVPAIFAETTQPTELAEAIAEEVGDSVEVVELFSESLGEEGSGAETYVAMMRVNAERIAGALT